MSRNAEAKIQAACVAYVRAVAPQVIIAAIPNGGLRTRAEAALLKWTGVVAGIPDTVILAPNGLCAFAEFKTPEGKLSQAQADMLGRLDDMGFPCAIIRSVEEMRDLLASLGIETREAGEVAA